MIVMKARALPFDSVRSLRTFDIAVGAMSEAVARRRRHTAESNGGEAGIRTLDTAFRPYNGLANRRLQPLGHLTDPVSIRPTMSCGKEIVPAIVPEIWQLSLPRAKAQGTAITNPRADVNRILRSTGCGRRSTAATYWDRVSCDVEDRASAGTSWRRAALQRH